MTRQPNLFNGYADTRCRQPRLFDTAGRKAERTYDGVEVSQAGGRCRGV